MPSSLFKPRWKKIDPRNYTKHHENFLCLGSRNFVNRSSWRSESSILSPVYARIMVSSILNLVEALTA